MAESEHLSSEIKQLSDVYRIWTVRLDTRDGDNNDAIHGVLCSILILHRDILFVYAFAYLLHICT